MNNFLFAVVLEADYNLAQQMGIIPDGFKREEYFNLYREMYQEE